MARAPACVLGRVAVRPHCSDGHGSASSDRSGIRPCWKAGTVIVGHYDVFCRRCYPRVFSIEGERTSHAFTKVTFGEENAAPISDQSQASSSVDGLLYCSSLPGACLPFPARPSLPQCVARNRPVSACQRLSAPVSVCQRLPNRGIHPYVTGNPGDFRALLLLYKIGSTQPLKP